MFTRIGVRHIFGLVLGSAAIGFPPLPAVAQTSLRANDLPTISRTCLWNADRNTWSELGLKRKQIVRLKDIRARYPAVVDGQWIVNEQNDADDADRSPVVADTIVGPDLTSNGAHGSGSAAANGQPWGGVAVSGLQAELRAVLTPKELLRWSRLCGL